jgi:hypothetical protein
MEWGDAATWAVYAAIVLVVAGVLLLWAIARKDRPFTTGDVLRASRWTRGNRLFPTQVAITPTSVVQHTPRWIGSREESIHIAHIASVKIDTHLMFSDVIVETSGGADPIVCHGHRNADAVRIKTLIEHYQTEQFRPARG